MIGVLFVLALIALLVTIYRLEQARVEVMRAQWREDDLRRIVYRLALDDGYSAWDHPQIGSDLWRVYPRGTP